MKKRTKCKVCNGSGFLEGIKCLYCISGYYIIDVPPDQPDHEQDGEIIEFDIETEKKVSIFGRTKRQK